MTKFELFQALAAPRNTAREYTASDSKHYIGILESVEREDGSGRSFNVRLITPAGYKTIHVRTPD